jgi:hypothetical protein
MSRLVNPDEETTDWRAVCGKSACTVRREGRVSLSYPYQVKKVLMTLTLSWVT